jgi:hypothetical protein
MVPLSVPVFFKEADRKSPVMHQGVGEGQAGARSLISEAALHKLKEHILQISPALVFFAGMGNPRSPKKSLPGAKTGQARVCSFHSGQDALEYSFFTVQNSYCREASSSLILSHRPF